MMVCTVSGVAAVDGYIYAKAIGPVEQTAFNFLIVKLSRLSAVQLSSSAALHHSTIFFFFFLFYSFRTTCSRFVWSLQHLTLYSLTELSFEYARGHIQSLDITIVASQWLCWQRVTFKLSTLFYSLSNRVRSYAHTHPTAFL